MSLITKDGFMRIGIPWGFNEWTDVDNYYTEKIYSNINVVDFIPVIPKFNTSAIASIVRESKLSSMFKNLYIPDPDKGCEYYNGILKKFNLSGDCHHVKGVRLYLTDDTQLAETITNDYTENVFATVMKEVSNKVIAGKQAFQMTHTAFKTGKGILYSPPFEITKLLNPKSVNESMSTIKSLLSGMRIDYPVVWTNTNYVRRTTLNVVLSSPYGHPEAVWVWIVRPLLYLILLGTPINWGGPVGYPLYISVRAHGLFKMQLAAIESITIDRGGANTVFNIYKQPLKVVVNISIRDLYSTLSVDPTISIDASEIINPSSLESGEENLDIYANSMPTVDKLIRSFAPEKRSNRSYISRMRMHNHPPTTEVSLEENVNTQPIEYSLSDSSKTTRYLDKTKQQVDEINGEVYNYLV